MKRATIAVDEAKESFGGFVNIAVGERPSKRSSFSTPTMAGATKGNELFTIGIDGMRGALKKGQGDVEVLAGALIFAADHGAEPTTKAFKQQTEQMHLSLGETRDLADTLGWLASEGEITRESAYELMGMLNQQADAMEDNPGGRPAALRALPGARHRRRQSRREGSGLPQGTAASRPTKMRELADPVFALRDAQREYNAAFKRWSDLAVTGTANADDLREAEDDLTEAGLDLKAAEDDVEKSAGKMEDALNDARAEVGLLDGRDVAVEGRHRPVVRRGQQRPPLAPGDRHQRRV